MSNREIKFSCMWSDGKSWMDLRYTLNEMCNGDHWEAMSDMPLLKRFIHKHTRQYTGLKDKNEKEIYEGDVVNCDGEVIGVTYEDYGFAPFVYQIPNACDTYSEWEYKSIEVIGNIYENPELIGE